MDLAVPAFGYKNHVGIDRRHGLIRTWSVTDAARHGLGIGFAAHPGHTPGTCAAK